MTGIRINGLDGRYGRMLINGRPVWGAMAAVYGLEHFPASWIENLEISRGSRQPFWGGGGAISGTVNLITLKPSCNRTEFSAKGGLFSNGESDWNGSGIISRTLNGGKQGLQAAYSGRYRSALDLNGDGISDIPRLHNQTLITEWNNILPQNRIFNLRTYYLFEERRGGNYFNQPFHLTDITEALTHHSAGIDMTFSASPSSSRTAHSFFFSLFFTGRNSYYGSGGKAAYEYLAENQVWTNGPQTAADTAALEKYERALNAYGKSFEVPFTAGYNATSRLTNKLNLEWGAEILGNMLRDAMPFYGRSLAENTVNGGAYITAVYSPLKRVTLTAGFRGDAHLMQSRMTTGHAAGNDTRWFFTPLPRINARIDFGRGINMFVGYGRGFRLPRIGSEDLHISLVGGDVLLIVQAPGLKPEVSDAADLDLGWEKKIEEHYLQIKGEGFFTRIRNMFILSGQTQTGDFALIEKRNGENATVWGITAGLEWKWKNWVDLDLGFTRQWGLFDHPQIIWENDEAGLLAHPDLVHTKTRTILRNPNWHGYAVLAVTPSKWEFSVSGLFTGNMPVPHVTGPKIFSGNASAALSEYTEIKYTPSFFDVGIRMSRQFRIADKSSLFPELGVQNLLNSFQRDLGTGVNRDPGYQYGPLRPRFFYAGLRVSL
jgi:outer membrane receptor for ferrienterochelin and colicins